VDDPLATADAFDAQVLFAGVDGTHVRCDLVTLAAGRWGRQALEPGTPLSVAFHVEGDSRLAAFATLARSWADTLATLRMVFVDNDDQHYVVLLTDRGQVMVGVPPFD
jgi:hypothetical protein